MNTKVSFDCVAVWWQDLTDPQKNAFADDPLKVSAYLDLRAKEITESTFVMPLSDQEVIDFLLHLKNFSSEQAAYDTVKPWRKYASGMGYNGPVVWKVRQGFTLKTHAPLVGPCRKGLAYLQEWHFTDTPTTDSLVFWVPRLAEQSTGKSITQMEALRAEQRRSYGLPSNHCDRFGSIALLFAIILAHFKRTGERVPLKYLYAASDTLGADDYRLIAGSFDSSDGLDCNYWDGPRGYGGVGLFLLGVEKFDQPAQKAGE